MNHANFSIYTTNFFFWSERIINNFHFLFNSSIHHGRLGAAILMLLVTVHGWITEIEAPPSPNRTFTSHINTKRICTIKSNRAKIEVPTIPNLVHLSGRLKGDRLRRLVNSDVQSFNISSLADLSLRSIEGQHGAIGANIKAPPLPFARDQL